jgi:hypothetical protein
VSTNGQHKLIKYNISKDNIKEYIVENEFSQKEISQKDIAMMKEVDIEIFFNIFLFS